MTGRRSRESLSAARRGESDMASAVQKIKFSPSRDIPFNKLVLSQANVRRVKAGVSIEQLMSDWQEADRETFARAWSSEVAEVAPFTDSEIHIVAGLLHRSGSACRMNSDASVSGPDRFPVNASSAARSLRRGLRARLNRCVESLARRRLRGIDGSQNSPRSCRGPSASPRASDGR